MVTHKYATVPIKIYFPLSFFVRISLLQSIQPQVSSRFGIYFALIWCYPKLLDLFVMTASHLLISKWFRGVSSPFLQTLLDASSNRLRYLECVLNRQYPIRKPVNLFSLVFLKPMHALSKPLEVTAPKSTLACLYVVLIMAPSRVQSLSNSWLQFIFSSFSLEKASPRPQKGGSGKINTNCTI